MMLKWIKDKLLNEQKESFQVDQEEILQEEIIVHAGGKKGAHYDDRNFRFPLIPDEMDSVVSHEKTPQPKEEVFVEEKQQPAQQPIQEPKLHYKKEYSSLFLQEEKKKVAQTMKKEETKHIFGEREREITPPPVKKQKVKPSKEIHTPSPKPMIRKSFKPTQIPSPIYGFQQRPDTEKKESKEIFSAVLEAKQVEIVVEAMEKENKALHLEALKKGQEKELLESVKVAAEGPVAEKLEELVVAEPEEIQEELIVVELEENLEELAVVELEENPEELAVVELEESPQELAIAELEEIPEELAGTEPEESLEESTVIELEEIPEEEKQEDVLEEPIKEEPRPRKRFVPYNVMMLKQDRQRMVRGQQREEVQNTSEEISKETQGETQENLSSPIKEKDMEEAYMLPPLSLLQTPPIAQENDDQWIDEQASLLQETLANFNVGAQVIDVTQGPSVTRFEIQPDPGVKVNKITNLVDDIKLSLAAKDIRIEAPIPGKSAVGIEVPNRTSKPVMLSEILRTPEFKQHPSPLAAAVGLDISGNPIVTDIQKMPHGLIAGATGSGKSVCINAILLSILYKATPYEVKVMLIDPKMVELAPYNNIPHLITPVITDAKTATAALKWAVEEMERRYELFAHAGARDLARYNQLVEKHGQGEKLPYLVIVIDELADLMMVAPGDVEEAICRIAQKARACGIHMLLATQRPSVDVITGLIKANIPTRLAFTVSSQIDSRTIIDMNGADKLLGRGDMLFLENGSSKAVRAQGVYVSDDEIEDIVSHVKQQMKPSFLFGPEDLVTKQSNYEVDDELFEEACHYVIEVGGASASGLQRSFRIGYNRAARLIDMMEAKGIISEPRGSKPRDVLVSMEDLAHIK